MIVTRTQFSEVVALLEAAPRLSLDTETTGLRPHHGDRLFSIVIGQGSEAFYFNFQAYSGLDADSVLTPAHLSKLAPLLAMDKVWYLHNALYDMAILAKEGLSLGGTIHCTQSLARVEYNEYQDYSLEACAERIGFKKDSAVEEYVTKHKLFDYTGPDKPGSREKLKHFDRVPFEIIAPYAETDANVTFSIARSQEKNFQEILAAQTKLPEGKKISNIVRNEQRLTRTIFNMEQRGVLIDRPYCHKASAYELDRAQKALDSFKRESGRDFVASNKLFQEVFASEKDKWEYGEQTATGQINPCFDSDVLAKFKNPAARAILEWRDAKSKSDFYRGFLYHADSDGVVHPHFNPGGTGTGRFSSSKPNFQNLTSEEDEEELKQEFVVRRAIIPRPGFFFIMPDYDQMEYRMMFDCACSMVGYQTELVRMIKEEGLDPHQATADLVTKLGFPLTRKRAKNGNFATLYGSGLDTLAATIGATREEARELKESIFKAAPEIRKFVSEITNSVLTFGYVRNWAGRRSYIRDKNFAYKGPNYYIQGGTADVNKFALNCIDDYLGGLKSKLVLTIHDENPIEVHESEADSVPRRVKEIMEGVYPYKYLPLTVGMEHSFKSLGDKVKGFAA